MFPSLRPTGSLLYLQPEELVTGAVAPPHPRSWLAVAYTGSSDFILHELFFRLQVRLRSYHDVSYKLFNNGTILRDGSDRALVKLETRSIVIGVEAEQPRRFLGKILKALLGLLPETGDSTSLTALCPRYALCRARYAHVSMNTFDTIARTLPSHASVRCIQTGASHPVVGPALTCAFGHTVPHAALVFGFPASSDARLPAPWSALHGESFLAVGRWTRSTNGLRWTELTASEADPLRRAEWARARDLFYRFVARDQATQIVLERVVYLDNPNLEVVLSCDVC